MPTSPETNTRSRVFPADAAVLDYLRRMTDDTGMIQHGVGGIPDRKTGYTTDDNVRAFLATVRLWRSEPERRSELEPLARCYLGFLAWAQLCDGPFAGWFVNFVSYDRQFLEERGSEDSLGRCLWALGEAVSGPLPAGCAFTARALWRRALSQVGELKSPRALAYALIGLCQTDPVDVPLIRRLVEPLIAGYHRYASDDWHWIEPYLTYDNARVVEALWRAADATGDAETGEIARALLNFLTECSFEGDTLIPVGNRGWFRRGGEKAIFDQQTIEAGAYAELYRLVGDAERERLSLEWFHGRNVHRLPVYDPDTGACYDGLTPEGINLNQGAESVLSYLLAISGRR
jgi:hypothetical protein